MTIKVKETMRIVVNLEFYLIVILEKLDLLSAINVCHFIFSRRLEAEKGFQSC